MLHPRLSYLSAALLFVLSTTQCAKPRTELVVTVRSDLGWGSGQALQSLTVTVRRGGPTGIVRFAQTSVLGREQAWSLPLAFGLSPNGTSTDRLVLTAVTGR